MTRPVVASAALLVALGGGLATRPAGARTSARPPARLLVTATEFRFALSRPAITRGAAIVQLSDRGEDPHDLVVRRADRRGRPTGRRIGALALTQPGDVTTGSVRLARGRYALYCSLPGHRARGMRALLRVR